MRDLIEVRQCLLLSNVLNIFDDGQFASLHDLNRSKKAISHTTNYNFDLENLTDDEEKAEF